MKEYLESLEIGEGKAKLSADEIKAVIAKNGQVVTAEIEKVKTSLNNEINTYKSTITSLEEKIKSAPASEDMTKLQNEITAMKEAELKRKSDEKSRSEDEVLTNNITQVFGDKKFTSDYAKNGLINDIKVELNKPENKGKGISDIFTSLTKDKEGIFAGTSAVVNMPGVGGGEPTTPTDIDNMSYDQYKAWRKNN